MKELAQSACCIIIIPLAGETVCLSNCLSVCRYCVFTCQAQELAQSIRCIIIIPLAGETVGLSVCLSVCLSVLLSVCLFVGFMCFHLSGEGAGTEHSLYHHCTSGRSDCLSVFCVFTCQVKELAQSTRCIIIVPLAGLTVCLSFVFSPVR